MIFKALEIAQSESKAPFYFIDPLFLTEMELLAVKLLKSQKRKFEDLPILQNLSEKEQRDLFDDANRIETLRTQQSVKDMLQSNYFTGLRNRLLDHQFPIPQQVQVYMFFSPNYCIQSNEQPPSLKKEEESKIANKNAGLNPKYFSKISGESQPMKMEANKKSYNPHEVGLYYLKGSNKNPQTSTIQVQGEKRIIVQIKRDSGKVLNNSASLTKEIKQDLSTLDNIANNPNQAYQRFNVATQNGNPSSQSQNIRNQGNFQQENPNLSSSNQTVVVQKASLNQGLPLIGNNVVSPEHNSNFFSFGKNQKSVQKNYSTPIKILESNQEESSGNNQEEIDQKSESVSFKRGNAGDLLSSSKSSNDNFYDWLSENIRRQIEEKEQIERKKIEKRKKENRKILLGQQDLEDEKQKPINSADQVLLSQPNQSSQTFSGRLQNHQVFNDQTNSQGLASTENKLTNQGGLNVDAQNQQKTLDTFFTKSLLIENQQLDILIKKYNLESTPKKGKVEQTTPIETLSKDPFSNFFASLINLSGTQATSHCFARNQFVQKLQNPVNLENNLCQQNNQGTVIGSSQINTASIPTYQQNNFHPQVQFISQSLEIQMNLLNSSSSDHGFISQPSSHAVTYGVLLEFLYQKEFQRQNFQSNTQENKLIANKKKEFEPIYCSRQNFDSLFEEFSQLINPSHSIENQTQSIHQKPQNQPPNSFDAFSQQIGVKIFNPSNNFDPSPANSPTRLLKLDSTLSFGIFIDLMTKYQRNLTNELIEQAYKFVGQTDQRSQSLRNSGLIGQVDQICNGDLKRSIDHAYKLIQVQLIELYHLIPKNQNGKRINPQTGKAEYLQKSELTQSELALYQYVQSCMLNYNQIVNDPLYTVRRYNQVIENSLKQLIWIKQIDSSGKLGEKVPTFQQISTNQNTTGSLDSFIETNPAKMRESIEKYLSQLQHLSLKLQEQVDLVCYDLHQIQYKSPQRYYSLESSSHISSIYPQIELIQNFPKSFLNELGKAISFTRNIQQNLSSAQFKQNRIDASIQIYSKELFQENNQSQNDDNRMIDQNQSNKINHFISKVTSLLSGIESELQIMNANLFTEMS